MIDFQKAFDNKEIIEINGRKYKVRYIEDSDPYYRTSAIQEINSNSSGYCIELKQAKPNKQYNFSEFKLEKRFLNALFLIYFKAEPPAHIHLPKHMQCWILPQEKNVTIHGNYQTFQETHIPPRAENKPASPPFLIDLNYPPPKNIDSFVSFNQEPLEADEDNSNKRKLEKNDEQKISSKKQKLFESPENINNNSTSTTHYEYTDWSDSLLDKTKISNITKEKNLEFDDKKLNKRKIAKAERHNRAIKRHRLEDKNRLKQSSNYKNKHEPGDKNKKIPGNILTFTVKFWKKKHDGIENLYEVFFTESYVYLYKEKNHGNALQLILLLFAKLKTFDIQEWENFFKRLSNLINYYLQQIDIKNQKNNEQNSRYIASILHKLGKFSEDKKAIFLSYLLPQTIASLLEMLNKLDDATPRELSNVIFSLGKMAETITCRHLLKEIDPHNINQLLIKLNKLEDANSRDLSNALYSLYKIAEIPDCQYLLKEIDPTVFNQLVSRLSNLEDANSRDLSNAIYALRKLTMTVPHLLKKKNSILFAALLKKLSTLKEIRPKALSEELYTIYTISEQKTCEHLLEEVDASIFNQILTRLSNLEDANSQDLSNAIYSVFKIARQISYQHLLEKIDAPTFNRLLTRLSNLEDANSQDLSNAIYAVGKIAKQVSFQHLLEKVDAITFTRLLTRLSNIEDTDSQGLSNAIYALGAIAEQVSYQYLLKIIDFTTLTTLLTKLSKLKKISSQGIANTIYGLGKITAYPNLIEKKAAAPLAVLLKTLSKLEDVSSQHIGNSLWALGKFTEQPNYQPLLNEIDPATLNLLLNRLNNSKNIYPKHISQLIWALGRFAQQPNSQFLLTQIDPTTFAALLKKLSELENVSSQSLNNTIWSLSKIIKTKNSLLDNISPEVLLLLINKCLDRKQKPQSALIIKNQSKYFKNEIYRKFNFLENITTIFSFKQKINPSQQTLHKVFVLIESLLKIHVEFSRLHRLTKAINQLYLLYPQEENYKRIQQLLPLIKLQSAKYPPNLKKIIDDTILTFDKKEETTLIINSELPPPAEDVSFLNQPILEKISDQKPQINQNQNINIPKYDIHDESDIKKLEQENKIIYDRECNKKRTKIKVVLAPVAILKNELGVFAAEDLHRGKKETTIGCYAGEECDPKVTSNSMYIFQITSGEEILKYIDAEKLRDWTAFVNHSPLANVYVIQKNGKIYFYLARDIKKGEQLIFDYGRHFFSNLDFKPYYIHSTDSWFTPQDLYLKNSNYYSPGLYKFSDKACNDLNLNKDVQWVIPKLFLAVMNNDVKEIEKLLAEKHPADLLSYAVEKDTRQFSDFPKQQHITPLMLACYLGHKETIEVLMKAEADVDRCMLVSGHNALTLLMSGQGNKELIDEIGEKLLNKMLYPFTTNRDELGLLHYAIVRNSTKLVKQILEIAARERQDIFEPMLNREITLPFHADIDYCIKQQQYDILKTLLDATINNPVFFDGKFAENIQEGLIFKEETFASLSLAEFKGFQSFIEKTENKKIKEFLEKSGALNTMRKYIPLSAPSHSAPHAAFYNTVSAPKETQSAKTPSANFQSENSH